MPLLRELRAELLRACGLWALSPARGTTVRLLLRSYRAARPRYAHRAPPRPPRGDRARVRAARGHRMSVAYRHHMTRAADCGASHVRGERTLRVRSMYVPVLRSCIAYALRTHVCSCTAPALLMHALLTTCSCIAYALHACTDFASTARAPRMWTTPALLLHRSCDTGPLLVRSVRAHTHAHAHARAPPVCCPRVPYALHVRCTYTAHVVACTACLLNIHCVYDRVRCTCTAHALLTCAATCRTLHVRCPRATLTCALSMRGTSTCTGTALHSTCIPRELFMRSTSASPARLLTLCTHVRCSRTTPALLK